MNCICNKIIRKTLLYGAVTTGLAAGVYIGVRKITQIIEDERLARYYEDEIEKILNEEERMQFYEDEFIRQENEEQEELEKAVNKFNSRRIKREECPRCGKERKYKK